MAVHKIKEYSDGLKRIPFCEVCGYENPVGDCPGEYVEQSKKVNEKVDTDKERS